MYSSYKNKLLGIYEKTGDMGSGMACAMAGLGYGV
jgi:hypothetical protein